MTKTAAEIRFNNARKRLSAAFQTLEETVKKKLHETIVQSRMMNISNDSDTLHSRIIEQSSIIQNLGFEINNLQKNLAELGRESEFLNEKNNILAQKINDFHEQNMALVNAIELDLIEIEEVIKNEENEE